MNSGRKISAVDLAIMGLAAWRLSSLLGNVNEHGPYDILTELRRMTGVWFDERSQPTYKPDAPRWQRELVTGLLCPWCNSVWIGGAMAAAYALLPMVTVMLCLPLALSAVAIIITTAIDTPLGRG